MTFSVTALNLANRVARRRRMKDMTSFSNIDELATLDALNKAIDEVLSARRWEFDLRHAQFTTKALMSNVTCTTSSNQASVQCTTSSAITDAMIYGDFITRINLKGSTDYGNTAMRYLYGNTVTASTSFLGTMASTVGESVSSTTGELFWSEYLLPDTVRNVVGARYQQQSLSLEQVGSEIEFDELYPRPRIQKGGPEVISVGGYDIGSYLSSGSAPAPKLRMIVYPVPDDEYVIDYQYVYRHPELTATTSTLDGVPPEVVDSIVDLATSDMIATFDRNVNDARAMRQDSLGTMLAIHSRHSGMYADRASIGNWDGTNAKILSRNSRTQGRLIGGD